MGDPVLHTNNLAIGYLKKRNTKKVAENINLALLDGRLTCLMGPNGIGKSTLIKTITGVLNPLAGTVWYKNSEIHHLNQTERAKAISVVLTEKPSLGFMTVRDLVSLGRFPYTNWQNNLRESDIAVIDKAIAAVGLNDLANAPINELSDGNLQKVTIGRALAQDTDLIILDEPTIHLDVNNKTNIIKLLRRLSHENGKTILLSTHDLELAMNYADILWLFSENGIHQGFPEDLALNGQLNNVFSEVVAVEETSEFLSKFSLSGDEKHLKLLAKVLLRYKDDIKIEDKVHLIIKPAEKGICIEYKDKVYNSLEALIRVITNKAN